MYHAVYILWALLPFALFSLSLWAVLKRWFKVPGRENAKQYLAQAIYSSVCLVVAILFDQYCLEDLVNFVTMGMLDIALARFLLYPFVLLMGSVVPVGGPKSPAPAKFVFSS